MVRVPRSWRYRAIPTEETAIRTVVRPMTMPKIFLRFGFFLGGLAPAPVVAGGVVGAGLVVGCGWPIRDY